ncbi:HTH-type transcriptional regulator (MarR family protein) [Desulforapulum autotrophicum HRM2]|uniref:HTH-type transcriptional regulator (MarR family protein) n=1 Tax=Desulforapulum autotrophicum (strain ATCC 43914 / DSM 3382 / VKM B-1955 / HRM2) TaxID=177437 RepID=C0QAG6_DESAH|nr:MarR family winged helix-turn-helix transcriptional regulator [Desulforapulum autotrophicum]ACN14751.1 HTH-type transcriptional regulator (MarR family protein) [Desulforapulum autotrophicum HRM2]
MKAIHEERCKELLTLLRKMIQSIDLYSKDLNKRCGLTGPQLVVLKEVTIHEEISVSDLARTISLSQGTVTDIINRLENKGLMKKERSKDDKRRVIISPSEKCVDILKDAPPPLEEKFTGAFIDLEEWEQLMILSAMNRLVTIMAARI